MKKERSILTMDGRAISPCRLIPPIYGCPNLNLVELFGVIAPTVRAGIKAVYKSGVLKEYETKRYLYLSNGCGLDVYSLDMVVALAFRIESFGASKVRNTLLEKIMYRRKEKTYLLTLPFRGGWSC